MSRRTYFERPRARRLTAAATVLALVGGAAAVPLGPFVPVSLLDTASAQELRDGFRLEAFGGRDNDKWVINTRLDDGQAEPRTFGAITIEIVPAPAVQSPQPKFNEVDTYEVYNNREMIGQFEGHTLTEDDGTQLLTIQFQDPVELSPGSVLQVMSPVDRNISNGGGTYIPGLLAYGRPPGAGVEDLYGSVSGAVVDEDGEPVPNAQAELVGIDGAEVRVLDIDSDGSIRGDVPAGEYTLRVDVPEGYEPPADFQVIVRPQESVELGHITASRLPGSVSGVVRSGLYGPIAQAEVTLVPDGGGEVYEAMTDTDGNFVIADLPAGEYVASVFAPGAQMPVDPVYVSVHPGEDSPVDFGLLDEISEVYSYVYTVVWTDKNRNGTRDTGEEMPGVKIALVREDGSFEQDAITGDRGTASFDFAPIGNYTIQVTNPGGYRIVDPKDPRNNSFEEGTILESKPFFYDESDLEYEVQLEKEVAAPTTTAPAPVPTTTTSTPEPKTSQQPTTTTSSTPRPVETTPEPTPTKPTTPKPTTPMPSMVAPVTTSVKPSTTARRSTQPTTTYAPTTAWTEPSTSEALRPEPTTEQTPTSTLTTEPLPTQPNGGNKVEVLPANPDAFAWDRVVVKPGGIAVVPPARSEKSPAVTFETTKVTRTDADGNTTTLDRVDSWVEVGEDGMVVARPPRDTPPGEYQVSVTASSGEKDTITVSVEPNPTMADRYDVAYTSPRVNVGAVGNTGAPRADVSENGHLYIGRALPVGTKFAADHNWASIDSNGRVTFRPPADARPGTYEVPVTFTFPDNSSKTVTAVFNVVDSKLADNVTFSYKPAKVRPGSTITIPRTGEVPENTTFAIAPGVNLRGWTASVDSEGTLRVTAPKRATGTVDVPVVAYFSDGSTKEIAVRVSTSSALPPTRHTTTAGQRTSVDLSDGVPKGTKYTLGEFNAPGWTAQVDRNGTLTVRTDATVPVGQEVTVPVRINYPDGSTEVVKVPVAVRGEVASQSKGSSENLGWLAVLLGVLAAVSGIGYAAWLNQDDIKAALHDYGIRI